MNLSKTGWGYEIMLNRLDGSRRRRAFRVLPLLAASAILFSYFQSACIFKKSKSPVAAIAPIRVAILPFNVPPGNKDLQWLAMAAPVLLAKNMTQTPAIDLLPLWEAMPTAVATAGVSRNFNEELTVSTANWLGVKWSIAGEIAPTKTGVSLIIDFIPAKGTQVPFRYMKRRRIESLGFCFHEAFKQFYRYQTGKSLPLIKSITLDMKSAKDLSEALDREYGWFVEADPGKAQEAVSDLARSDERLAKFLFNPSLYSGLTPSK
jgi:hypothetical protein